MADTAGAADKMRMTQPAGLSRSDRLRRLQFLDLEERGAGQLARIQPPVGPILSQIVERLSDRLGSRLRADAFVA